MCGRARCTLTPQQISSSCGFSGPIKSLQSERFHPSYNVSPGSYMPVVHYHQEEDRKCPVIHYMKWGLVPTFTKRSEKPDHFRMFNARSESVNEKASFRRLLPKSRCVAVAEGFYEWKKDGMKKQPYYIHFKDERPLVFAALYDCWTNSEGEVLYTFTILTTCPSKPFEWLHDRMPVILECDKSIEKWLNPDNFFPSLQILLQPYDRKDLVWYAVDPAIGKVSFDGPECVKQIKVATEIKNSISTLFQKQQPRDGCEDASVEAKNYDQKSVSKVPYESPSNKLKLPQGSFLLDEEVKAFRAAVHPDDPLFYKSGIDVEEKEAKMKEDQSKVKDENISLSGNEARDMQSPKKENVTDGKGIKRERSPEQCVEDESGCNAERQGEGLEIPNKKAITNEKGMQKLESSFKDGNFASLGTTRKPTKSLKKEEVHGDGKCMERRRSSPDDQKLKRASMVAGEKQTSLLNFFGKH